MITSVKTLTQLPCKSSLIPKTVCLQGLFTFRNKTAHSLQVNSPQLVQFLRPDLPNNAQKPQGNEIKFYPMHKFPCTFTSTVMLK